MATIILICSPIIITILILITLICMFIVSAYMYHYQHHHAQNHVMGMWLHFDPRFFLVRVQHLPVELRSRF